MKIEIIDNTNYIDIKDRIKDINNKIALLNEERNIVYADLISTHILPYGVFKLYLLTPKIIIDSYSLTRELAEHEVTLIRELAIGSGPISLYHFNYPLDGSNGKLKYSVITDTTTIIINFQLNRLKDIYSFIKKYKMTYTDGGIYTGFEPP